MKEETKKEMINFIESNDLFNPDPLFAQNDVERGHNRGWNLFREVLLDILKDKPLNLIA